MPVQILVVWAGEAWQKRKIAYIATMPVDYIRFKARHLCWQNQRSFG